MVFRALCASFWIVVIGGTGVLLELSRVRLGHRIQQAEVELGRARERLREARVLYNRQVAPDLLELQLEEYLKHRDPLEI